MKLIKILVFLLFKFASYSLADDKNYGSSCSTPNSLPGTCIYAKSCQLVVHILKKQPLSVNDKIYLSRSQCGYSDKQPLVCCPNSRSQVTTIRPIARPNYPSYTSSNILPEPGSGKCGAGYEDKIFGGEETEIDEFPWLALLEYQNQHGKRSFGCGGSLISQYYVLTAAHCLDPSLPQGIKLISVRLGEWDTRTLRDCDTSFANEIICNPNPPVNVLIEQKIPHEDYVPRDRNHYHDIALLRLATPVQYTDFIQPICLPKSRQLNGLSYVGESMIVAGWGRTETRQKSDRKLQVKVDGVDLNKCYKTYRNIDINLQQFQMCAGGVQGEDSCQGDSGGPLMTKSVNGEKPFWFVSGIVSFGPSNCGLRDWPGVYTRVDQYIDWIYSKVRP